MGEDEIQRARRREFIRSHHPDNGGDPLIFMAGLDRFDGEPGGRGALRLPRVVVVPHRAWPVRLMAALIRRLRGSRRAPRVR
jgi:hypothetical protein